MERRDMAEIMKKKNSCLDCKYTKIMFKAGIRTGIMEKTLKDEDALWCVKFPEWKYINYFGSAKEHFCSFWRGKV